jgi:uncharacterized protein YbjT (DUF2867 family)
MKEFRVILLGATGAVGGAVLSELEAMGSVSRVTVLARRASERTLSPKVAWQIVDPLIPDSYQHLLAGHDTAICTLGVGQPSKVSREEFTRVDHDAVLGFAKACKDCGVEHFQLLGSVASNPASSNFYLKSKGALREAIIALRFKRTSIFQPSMLITKTNRYGMMQGLMLAIWPWLSHLLIGPLKIYRGVTVERLGQAMARNIEGNLSGAEILHWGRF